MKRLCPALAAVLSLLSLAGCSRSASSIGIIGGADGPTAIYTAYRSSPAIRWVPAVFVIFVLAVIGIALWIKRK